MKKILVLLSVLIGVFLYRIDSEAVKVEYTPEKQITSNLCVGNIEISTNPHLDYLSYTCELKSGEEITGFYLDKPYDYLKYGYFQVEYNPVENKVYSKMNNDLAHVYFEDQQEAKESIVYASIKLLYQTDTFIANRIDFKKRQEKYKSS